MKIPATPPDLGELLVEATKDDPSFLIGARPVDDTGRYLHWDEMLHRQPPEGLSHQRWWLSTAFARRSMARELPLIGTNGRPFRFSNVDAVQQLVHLIDQQAGGQILADEVVTNLRSSNRYLVSSLIEEAITSSQLEGASTTRRVAKELLQTGRAPRGRSEQMIVNNFRAMQVAQEIADRPLDVDTVLGLHETVTAGALDDPADAGRIQGMDEERIALFWPQDNTLLHRPPPADQLPDRLQGMCAFANGQEVDGFIHPVVRAIIVHFWLAYDHPFVDGNGRTARALFYRSMLNEGYWLTQYLSISSILKKAPAKYAKSYLYSETDDNDITYFVIYQLQVIKRAIDSLHDYLRRKIEETRDIEVLISSSPHLNHRQITIVGEALRDPGEPFTITAQQRRHGVTYQSARTDLLGLESLELLTKQRIGKKFVFRAAPDLLERLRAIGSGS